MKRTWISSVLAAIGLLLGAASVVSLQGCVAAAAGAAGAAGGYEASQHGYEVQSPITKKPEKQKE